MPGQSNEAADLMVQLHRAGWSLGDAAFTGPVGLVWVVSGSNGEDPLRTERATRLEACQQAEQ